MKGIKKFFSMASLQYLGGQFLVLHRRFPLVLLCSLIACVCIITYFEQERLLYLHSKGMEREGLKYLIHLAMTFVLGISLFFSCRLMFERSKSKAEWLLLGAIAIFMALFYEHCQHTSQRQYASIFIRFLVLLVGFHCLVAFAPFWRNGNVNAFWHYNKTIFLGILAAFLYSITFSGGISLALLAIGKLFDVTIEKQLYQYLWILLNSYFNTLFFLVRVPENFDELEQKSDYPMGLKYFTQYVLLPLVLVYLLILYGYETKIVLQWNLPKGLVSILVLASAILGILAFLLLYPLQSVNTWVHRFTKGYYVLLLPLIVLLFVAIGVRISDYGITEERYIVATLAVWLLGITMYFVVSKTDNIIFIPMSLFGIAIWLVLPPFDMFSVANRSQYNRLYALLEGNNWLKNGKIAIDKAKLTQAQNHQITESFQYFSSRDLKLLQPLFIHKLKDLDTLTTYASEEKLHVWAGKLAMIHIQQQETDGATIWLPQNDVQHVRGYDYFKTIFWNTDEKRDSALFDIEKYRTRVISDSLGKVKILIENEILFTFDIAPLAHKLSQYSAENLSAGKVKDEDKYVFAQQKGWKVGIEVRNLNLKKNTLSDSIISTCFRSYEMSVFFKKE